MKGIILALVATLLLGLALAQEKSGNSDKAEKSKGANAVFTRADAAAMRLEFRTDMQQAIQLEAQKQKHELMTELRQTLKQELRQELKSELRQELKAELRQELKSEIKMEIRSEMPIR